MQLDVEQISDAALGDGSDVQWVAAAIASAQALIDEDPSLARWVKPLIRAIERERLRMPSLSPTVHRIVQLIESTEVDLDELAQAVSGDPALAARVMGVANSSYFRGATEVPNVREALMRMGIREARTIVVVVALRSTLLRSPGLGDLARTLWKHSLLAASATQEIAQEMPPWEASGFLAGLLHDLGKLVVLAFVAELPAWQDDGDSPNEAAVEAILDATHASLGALVLGSWGFPDGMCHAVLSHHASGQCVESARGLAQAMELGHEIAKQIEAGWPANPEELGSALVSLAEDCGVGADRLVDIAAEAETTFETLSKLS